MADALRLVTSLRGDFSNRKADRKQVKVKCSFCDKESDTGKLAACSRCRSVRYCDANCQVAHFRASHKADCENFKDPPITDLFNVRNRPGTNYAVNPVFAKGSGDGVGCWVSVEDKISCQLESILSPTIAFPYRQDLVDDPKTKEMLARQKGEMKNLLTLRVLVQNRRKDRATVVIFSFASSIMATETSQVGKALKIWKGFEGLVMDYELPGSTKLLSTYPFADPWSVLRCSVMSVNGVQYPGNTTFPRTSSAPSTSPLDKIRDPAKGVVALGYGDYAVLEMQFRCVHTPEGDLPLFDALLDIVALNIGWSKQNNYVPNTPAKNTSTFYARFNYESINAYYADFMERGPAAHIASHFIDDDIEPKPLEHRRMETLTTLVSSIVDHKDPNFQRWVEAEASKASRGTGAWSSLTEPGLSRTHAPPRHG